MVWKKNSCSVVMTVFLNSETSNRGTGILIKNKLNYTIINKECDLGGNFILIKIKLENKTLIIASIYGPNINENIGVYEELSNKLLGLDCETIVLGGTGTVRLIVEALTRT